MNAQTTVREASARPGFGFAGILAVVPLATCIVAAACGPKVEAVDTAEVRQRDTDARVLVYVRDRDGIPPCPWEVLGTVEVEPGWTEDEGSRRRIRRAAAELGGHAVMVESAEEVEARVLRFFDPLCNPARDD